MLRKSPRSRPQYAAVGIGGSVLSILGAGLTIVAVTLALPSTDYGLLLGADPLGRDLWSRLLAGARLSLGVAACAVVLALAVILVTVAFGVGQPALSAAAGDAVAIRADQVDVGTIDDQLLAPVPGADQDAYLKTVTDEVQDKGFVVAKLEEHGVRAVNPACAFPMEMARFPARIWIVSHKPVAVAA